jgi:APA family basic amino acid/polyamine antiporter
VQGTWAAILALSGSYERLFSLTMFVTWIFFGMTVIGVLVLRRKYPDLPRPYKMWGYPLTPLLFAGIALGFVINTFVQKPGPSLAGLLIVATGFPIYWLWRRPAMLK